MTRTDQIMELAKRWGESFAWMKHRIVESGLVAEADMRETALRAEVQKLEDELTALAQRTEYTEADSIADEAAINVMPYSEPQQQVEPVALDEHDEFMASAAFMTSGWEFPRDPKPSRDWTLFREGWLAAANVYAAPPAVQGEPVACPFGCTTQEEHDAHDNNTNVTGPHPMLSATHFCRDCRSLWRQCDDFAFSLRSAQCCDKCNNAPVADQLTPLTATPGWWHGADGGGPFRLLVAACNRLSNEAEEYTFDDGMGRGALQSYWDEFEAALERAQEALR